MDNVLLFSILALVVGILVGSIIVWVIFTFKASRAMNKANKFIEDAKKEAERNKRDTLLELKQESFRLKQETEAEIKEKKAEILQSEDRLLTRENNLDKREEMLQNRDNLLQDKENDLLAKQKILQDKEEKMDVLLKEEVAKLETIAKYSKEKAREAIMQRVESDMELEITNYIKESEAKAKLEAHEIANQAAVEVCLASCKNS